MRDENGEVIKAGAVPQQGDDVEIISGWNMVLDLE